MKRLVLLIFVLCCVSRGRAQFGSYLQSTNPVYARELISRNVDARAMKFNPSTQQLLLLSSNNTVAWLNAGTLATERELPLDFGATDLALSETGEILFIASATNHAIYPVRVSDFQTLEPISLGKDSPFAVESLPGSTNGFAALALRDSDNKWVHVFENGSELHTSYSYPEMARTPTNVCLFYDSFGTRYRLELHMENGALVRNTFEDVSLLRTGSSVVDGAYNFRFASASFVVDTNEIYLFGGSSNSLVSVYDNVRHVAPTPMLTLTNIAGPPRDAVRWGADGLAFIANGIVTTFRSTLSRQMPPADLSVTTEGWSGYSGQQTHPQILLHNTGPAAATDIRVVVQVPSSTHVNFTKLVDATASTGLIEKFNFGYGFSWRVSRLEPGETATVNAVCDNPGFGFDHVDCAAIHAEADPTPYDTRILEWYELTLDPAETNCVKKLATSFWGGGLGGSIYVPGIDQEVGVTSSNLASVNPRTGHTTHYAALDTFLPRIFANDLDSSTFFVVHNDFKLYSAQTMMPLWSMPRGSYGWGDSTRANFNDMALLVFPGVVTNFILSYVPPVYPHTTNALALYVGTNEFSQTLEGGDQLFRTGSNSFFTYSRYGKLQSIRLDGNNLVLQAQWSDRLAGHEMDYKNGIVYSADGRTYNATNMQPLGAPFGGIQDPQSVRAYPQIDRVVFVMTRAMRIYELSTRQLLGTINSPSFVWNYEDTKRSIDFSPPDVLYLSSTTEPTLARTPLLRGLEPTVRQATDQTAEISFVARSGKTYAIEGKANIESPEWILQTEIAGNDAIFTHTFALDGAAQFFRIVQH